MAQSNITYVDKVTSNPQPSIPEVNKVTGDDMTEIKKVVNDNADDVESRSLTNVYEVNDITFVNNIGDYFGKFLTPRTGAITFDETGAVTGAISVVYYNNSTLDIPITPILTNGSFLPNELNKLYFERDADNNYTLNIINEGVAPIVDYFFSPNSINETYGTLTGYSGVGVGEYIEFKARFTDVTKQSPILGDISTTNSYLTQFSSGNSLMRSPTASAGVVATGTVSNNTWSIWRLTNTGTDLTLDVDGTSVTGIALNTLPSISQLFARGNPIDSTGDPTRFMDGDFEYIDFNGDVLKFTNTTKDHLSASSNISLELLSVNVVDISTLFTTI
jgi:hypothetical protein